MHSNVQLANLTRMQVTKPSQAAALYLLGSIFPKCCTAHFAKGQIFLEALVAIQMPNWLLVKGPLLHKCREECMLEQKWVWCQYNLCLSQHL